MGCNTVFWLCRSKAYRILRSVNPIPGSDRFCDYIHYNSPAGSSDRQYHRQAARGSSPGNSGEVAGRSIRSAENHSDPKHYIRYTQYFQREERLSSNGTS